MKKVITIMSILSIISTGSLASGVNTITDQMHGKVNVRIENETAAQLYNDLHVKEVEAHSGMKAKSSGELTCYDNSKAKSGHRYNVNEALYFCDLVISINR